MNKKYTTRHLILSGILIALGVLLPFVFHSIPNAGPIFLPMHIPVLVAGFFLPWQYCLAIGVLTPLLSSLLTGMPAMAPLPMTVMMACELAAYGVVISLLRKPLVKKDKWYSPLLALIPAMLIGRAVSGAVLYAAVELFGIKGPAFWVYVSGAVVKGLPGIAIQIVLIPALYHLLVRSLPGWRER